MDRRRFLAWCAAAAAGCARARPPLPPGELLSSGHALGHRLREGALPAPGEVRRRETVIVGAGIGGLSAAWRLRRAGYGDFELLELADAPGGNARWGENAVSAYPWGAHYLPLPTAESRATRLLLAELGALEGDPAASAPAYAERMLCAAPQERHYRHGTWSEGLAPLDGTTPREREQWDRFHARMDAYKALRGNDGRKAFAIPLAQSSRDPALLALDRASMADWLHAEGFDTAPVHWLVDYACRDDYGCAPRDTSAWAGIHYFASRDAHAANADGDTVLTWPEGNGWLVRRLIERAAPPITRHALVHRIDEDAHDVRLGVFLGDEGRAITLRARHVVWAAPLRFAARALGRREPALAAFEHAPWLVANLTLAEAPAQAHGAPLSWDNVLHDSPSLGYVVATHQDPALDRRATVFTYYLPLAGLPPAAGREQLLATSRETWAERVLADLERPHPEVRELVRRIDVMANGHAMVRPRPGLIWGEARAQVLAARGRVHYAHSDMSGLSIFEEAQYHGIAAAERVLTALGDRSASVL